MSSVERYREIRSKVSTPAIALLITAIIGILVSGYFLVGALTIDVNQAMEQAKKANPQIKPEEARPLIENVSKAFAFTSGIGIFLGLVILVGALKMKNLQSRGLAITSSILAMIPCISPCCVLGLPIGIWSLVVLGQPDVKQAFAAEAGAPPLETPEEQL
jgi:hypothetical protein